MIAACLDRIGPAEHMECNRIELAEFDNFHKDTSGHLSFLGEYPIDYELIFAVKRQMPRDIGLVFQNLVNTYVIKMQMGGKIEKYDKQKKKTVAEPFLHDSGLSLLDAFVIPIQQNTGNYFF